MDKNKGTPLRAYLDVLPKYTKRDYERRGEIIARTVNLERIMDTLIANHFCKAKKKRNELLFLLLSTERITYENKRQILQWIWTTHCPERFKEYPTIFKDMQEIGEFRNTLAHNHLDIMGFMEYERNETTVLHKYKNAKKVIEITEKDFKAKVNLITQYTHILMNWYGTTYFPL